MKKLACTLLFSTLPFALLTGCVAHYASTDAITSIPTPQLQGNLRGGQNPVSLATVQMYAVNITAAAGASTLIAPTTTTNSNGDFTFTTFTCPANTATPVYLVATGGNPGLASGTNNTSLSLMSAIGPCSSLTGSSFIQINEVTTAAAVWAIGSAMTDYAHVGSTTLAGITASFTLASELASFTSGSAPGMTLPAGSYTPVEKLNTIGNILASCVNSDGTGSTGNATTCGMLFTDTTYSGTRPTDTVGAAIRIAANPSTVGSIFVLGSSSPPFAPALNLAPSDWTMTIASIIWPAPAAVSYGTILGPAQLDATATVPGTFTYTPAPGSTPATGTDTLSATFTPTDTADYPAIPVSTSLTVNKAMPIVIWTTPTPISNGVALSATQLDATASVAGTFVYSPATGTVLSAGNQTLNVTFTPTDTTDYTTAPQSTTLAVNNPGYTFSNVAIIGGGYITGIVCHPTQANLRYVRTDVGGAYKWNANTSTWTPLTDFNSRNNYSDGGTDSIALDPNDPNRLYLAVGEYTESYGSNGEFLLSDNQGASFTTVNASFKMGSNDNGRSAGERLAVDPNLGTTLFYGSYNNGLWTSTNRGLNWSQVSSFPVTGYTSGAGVVFVDFITSSSSSGSATPILYVGVSDTGPSSSTGYYSLYRSTNGGSTWTAVPGQPTGYFPIRGAFGVDGNLYITYSNNIGPGGATAGVVYKYTPPVNTSPNGNGTWTNISPNLPPNNNTFYNNGGYGGLALDPENSGYVMVSTLDDYGTGDDIYRSTNGGASWVSVILKQGATHNTSLSPWVTFGASSTSTGNWPTAMAIDPLNSAHFMYGTGQTLWDSTNVTVSDTGGKVAFNIGASGIEETVVQALSSPPSGGAILFSGVSDLGGFVHTSLTSSPAGGMIENPRLSQISSIDFAQSASSTVAFVGSGSSTFGGYSTNGGTSFTPFAAAAPSTVNGQGVIAVSANGSTFVWAPSDAPVAYSTNNGATWTASTNATKESGVIADRINSNKFYIYSAGSSNGTLQLSTNAGASFSTVSSSLPNYAVLAASYAAEGDLWLGSSTTGLYHSTNSGTTFTTVSGFSNVYSIGFGAPAVGGTYPAIYLIGQTTGGTYGFFRSINEGSTWTQINSTATQYGYAQPITGDPKTFGTVYIGTGGRGIILGTSTY